jgi:Rrf2 family nitric oxide-sensitive transcriptional repressor
MRLTLYTDYSLRVLMYLGLKRDGLATIAEVSESYGISRNHLMKIVHQLGLLGYVETVRGKGGGIRLARPAGAINLGEVVRRMEEDLALVQCFDPVAAKCRIESACVLRSVLGEALGAFLAVLDRYTLADLIERPRALSRLLATGNARATTAVGARA